MKISATIAALALLLLSSVHQQEARAQTERGVVNAQLLAEMRKFVEVKQEDLDDLLERDVVKIRQIVNDRNLAADAKKKELNLVMDVAYLRKIMCKMKNEKGC